ncbi:MAG: hypothetical protein RIS64_887 [Bacteroidota bacterium]|jgi:hypothetical protein
MNYKLQEGEVLFCGNCVQQFTTDKVNANFTCLRCGSTVTSWYQYQTHEDALQIWENINGKKQAFKEKQQNQFISSFKSNIGMANNHIERQIELLNNAKNLFSEYAEKVEDLRTSFASRVRGLEQDELNQDYMEFLEDFLGDYLIKLGAIRETIEDEYLPAVGRKIRYLEERE